MRRIEVSLGLIERSGRWFLQRRAPDSEVLPGRWEFPGGKHEPGEAPIEALRRELHEELGWEATRMEPLRAVVVREGDIERTFHLFHCEGPGEPSTELAWGWFTVCEIRRLSIPSMNGAILAALEAGVPWGKVPPSECS